MCPTPFYLEPQSSLYFISLGNMSCLTSSYQEVERKRLERLPGYTLRGDWGAQVYSGCIGNLWDCPSEAEIRKHGIFPCEMKYRLKQILFPFSTTSCELNSYLFNQLFHADVKTYLNSIPPTREEHKICDLCFIWF